VKTFDVVIVGGGLIGASIAFELAAELRVALLDRGQPGREASWAAAGMLSPAPESAQDAALVPFGIASLQRYPDFIAAVEGASGKSTRYAHTGALEIVLPPGGTAERDERLARYQELGIAAEIASTTEIRDRAGPGAAQGPDRAAIWLPDEATVEPRALTHAVLAAAEQRGVAIMSGCCVTGLLREGGKCTGVLAGEEKFSAQHVVIAAGCFSAEFFAGDDSLAGHERLGRYAPTRPVRGQMILFRHNARNDAPLKKVLRSKRGYLVPRRNGEIVAGSTSEDAGFEKRVTPEGLRKITDASIELMPSLVHADVVETWCGLRPGTPDDLPILGPTDMPGLLIATGHYRNGILLAPITAKLLRDWIVGGHAVETDVTAFSPMRFAGGQSYVRGVKN
jgi:glycine oxidase